MTDKITGGCKCGKVRYSGDPMDVAMFRCYCRDCQQLTGTGHSEMFPLLAGSLIVEGPMREFEMTGSSGQSTWNGFCPDCGAPIIRRSQRMHDRVYVHAGSLDVPARYAPDISIYRDSAQPWDLPSEG